MLPIKEKKIEFEIGLNFEAIYKLLRDSGILLVNLAAFKEW